METLDIREMFEETDYSKKLQNISWYKLVQMIKYKCKWYDKIFVQISQWHPSSKNCNVCGYYNKDLGEEKKMDLPTLQNTTQQRHKRRQKHRTRRIQTSSRKNKNEPQELGG